MKRVALILLALVVISAVVYFGGQNPAVRDDAEPTPVVLDAGAGVLQSITAHGRILPVRWMDLAFATGGRVEEVAVAVGDVVEEGWVLAWLEIDDLSYDLQLAELDVALQKARLAQAMVTPEPPEPEAIASANAQLASAQATLDRLQAGPDPQEIESARLGLESAKNNLWAAQASRDMVAGVLKGSGGADLDAAKARVAVAEVAVQLAELRYHWAQEDPTEEELLAAEARLAQCQETLAALQRPPAAEDLELVQVGLDQAELRLDQLKQSHLQQQASVEIVAPFAGTITSVDVRAGEFVGAYVPMFTLADLTEFQIETTDVDEWKLRRVRVGEIVDAYVMALEGRVLPVRVVSISPESVILPTGDTGYMVTLSLDRQDPDLRWGMSVRIEFRVKKG